MTAPQRIYAPGVDLLCAGERLTVLLPASAAAQLAELWGLVDGGAAMDDLLEWLVDKGFRAFESLIAVELQDDGVRVLLRGAVELTVEDSDGRQTRLSGAERRTWLDASAASVRRLWSAPTDSGLPIRSGIAGAAAFALDLSDEPAGADIALPVKPPAVPAAGLIASAPLIAAAPHAEESPFIAAAPAAAAAGPESEDVAPPEPDDAAPGAEAPPTGAGIAEAEAAPPAPQPEAEPVQPLEQAPQPVGPGPALGIDATMDPFAHLNATGPHGQDGVTAPDVIEAAAGRAESAAPHSGIGLDGSEEYEQVFGATRTSSVEGAAVRLAEPEDDGTAAEPGPTAPADAAEMGDHDGHTITTAALARLRSAGAPRQQAQPPAHGTVRAALCDNDHPNPPNETRCRVCGGPLDRAELHTVPRPVLGSLAVAGGPRVRLEGTVLIGRSPKMPTTMRTDVPAMVAVDSPEHGVSRTHIEVRVEGWSVSVIDLDTTNGTEVTLPGEAPRRLRRNEPCLITPGTVVTLGDEVSAVYEVTP